MASLLITDVLFEVPRPQSGLLALAVSPTRSHTVPAFTRVPESLEGRPPPCQDQRVDYS